MALQRMEQDASHCPYMGPEGQVHCGDRLDAEPRTTRCLILGCRGECNASGNSFPVYSTRQQAFESQVLLQPPSR